MGKEKPSTEITPHNTMPGGPMLLVKLLLDILCYLLLHPLLLKCLNNSIDSPTKGQKKKNQDKKKPRKLKKQEEK